MTTTTFKLHTTIRRHLADTLTPVSVYLKLRDHFLNPVLLESNDFRRAESCYSIVGLHPMATFKVQNQQVTRQLPDGSVETELLTDPTAVSGLFQNFLQRFDIEKENGPHVVNGFFGHTNFDGVQYFDTLKFDPDKRRFDIPDIHYSLYQYVIVFNHFQEEVYILQNMLDEEEENLEKVETLLYNHGFNTYNFELQGEESSNLTDEEYKQLVSLGKKHCQLGDVFQIVLSRQFQRSFKGDDFNVYRVLRSINPSPYLFFFDYGSYKIFGSSPEAQMVIQDSMATVNPIAGTYRRSGDADTDAQRADALSKDPKENAEHIMLVDLARNDLGRHSEKVEVQELKEVQYFSHVIHLVSKVNGHLGKNTNPIQVFGDTFPAGTLSGAPKYKAIELIDKYENQNRGYYGGAIGFIDFNGNMNQAIVIRSFFSQNNVLYYQAGAGIVAKSVEENELQEVNNKLGALTKALLEAEKI